MTSQGNTADGGHVGPARGAYDDAQKRIRERNDEARRVAKRQRAEADRRDAVGRSQREARDGVYR